MKTTCLYLWNKYPDKYYPKLDNKKKVTIVNQGGTSSGKTYSILQVLFTIAIENPKFVITIVGQDIPNLKRGAIRDAQNIVSENLSISSQILKWNNSDKIYTFRNGSIIEFTSYESSQDAKNGKRHVLFVNEANGIDYNVFSELDLRTSYRTFIDYNPNAEFWVHEKVIPLPNVAYFISNFEHNPFLSENIINGILRLKTIDTQLWRVYGLGQTGKIQGLVFNYRTTDRMPEQLNKLAYGMDFGFTNDPTTLVKCGLSDGVLYGEELIYQTGLTNRDINKLLIEAGVTKHDLIFADSADPKSIQELKLYGWNIKGADKGADSINYSIDILRSYGDINLTRNSYNWIKEANSYKWKEERSGTKINKPIDAFNHCWDACRYYALGMLAANKGKGILSFTTK
jgi:phage terminase large subunit